MSTFPNFNAWHKVPKDADIPAQTPYFVAEVGELRSYLDTGWPTKLFAGARTPDMDYYTEEPILSPEDEAVEKRAREMYYSIPNTDIWEHLDWYTHEAWYDLARKYVEK